MHYLHNSKKPKQLKSIHNDPAIRSEEMKEEEEGTRRAIIPRSVQPAYTVRPRSNITAEEKRAKVTKRVGVP
jgi:hypothetical protein